MWIFLHFSETSANLEPCYVLKSLSCWTSQLTASSSQLPPFVRTSSREWGRDSIYHDVLLVFSACRKPVRLRSITVLSGAAWELCSHAFMAFLPCSSLIRQSCSHLSVSILGFSHPTFILALIPIPWSSTPVPHLSSPAELHFIPLWSKQLHQTLPVSRVTARHSPSTNPPFSSPLAPTNILHCHCLTSKAPLCNWVPQLLPDTQQRNPITLP